MIKKLNEKQISAVAGGSVNCLCCKDSWYYFDKDNAIRLRADDEETCYRVCCINDYAGSRMYGTYTGELRANLGLVNVNWELCPQPTTLSTYMHNRGRSRPRTP